MSLSVCRIKLMCTCLHMLGTTNWIWSYCWTRSGVCTINVCLQCIILLCIYNLSHILDAVPHWFLVHHCLPSSLSRPSQLQLRPAKLREVQCIYNVLYMYGYCSAQVLLCNYRVWQYCCMQADHPSQIHLRLPSINHSHLNPKWNHQAILKHQGMKTATLKCL